MRLAWPFRRESQPAAAGRAAAYEPVQRQPALGGRPAWTDLPPVQRTLAGPPLIAPPRPFKADLAGARRPEPMLRRLGHELSRQAPAGVVRGITVLAPGGGRAEVRRAEEAPQPLLSRAMDGARRWLQRRARLGPAQAWAAPEADEGHDSAPPAAVLGPAGSPGDRAEAVDTDRGAATGAVPAGAAFLQRAVVAAARPRLSSLQPHSLPLAAPGRPSAPAASPVGVPLQTGSPPSLGQPTGRSEVGQSLPGSAPGTPATPPAAVPARGQPTIQRVVGPMRRVNRLGPPLSGQPGTPSAGRQASPAVGRSVQASPEPISPPSQPAVGPTGMPSGAPPGVPTGPGRPTLRLRRVGQSSPVQAETADAPGAGNAPDAAPAAPDAAPATPDPVPATPAPAAGEAASVEDSALQADRPTGASPLTEGDALVSSARRPVEAVRPATLGAAPGSLVRARTRRAAAQAGESVPLALGRSLRATRPALAATGSASAGRGSVQRSTARAGDARGRTTSAPAPLLGRSVLRAVPAANGAAIGAANEVAHAAATPAAALDLPGRPAVAGTATGRHPGAPADAPLVLRSAAPASAVPGEGSAARRPGSPVAVQSQAAEPLEISAPVTGGETATGGSAAAGSAAAAPAGLGEREMEDLLRRLYPKLRIQLARELLVARERAGLLTDLH